MICKLVVKAGLDCDGGASCEALGRAMAVVILAVGLTCLRKATGQTPEQSL